MQTILGAGGDIGVLLAKELKQFSGKIRLVARHPRQVNGDDELMTADLLNTHAVSEAVKGSEIVWHLPTSPERLIGKQFIDLANRIGKQKSAYRLLSPFLLSLGGLFDRTIKELVEMQYQNNQDYFFNSEKFCRTFQFTPTSYEEGIGEVLSKDSIQE